uniref:Uncharacterized protein n=1 Tax=Panagrolaimus sp. PS1159 TaxID=55785 RepID=A0AC35GMF1_9BILA
MGTGKTPSKPNTSNSKSDEESNADKNNNKASTKPKCTCFRNEYKKLVPAINSTPLYSQFMKRKHCRCKNTSWKAYKIYYFTVPPRFNSPQSSYIHVIEVRIQCHSCNLLFPLSFSFDRISEYRFGEHMKVENWIYTASIELSYERIMIAFANFDKELFEGNQNRKRKYYIMNFWISLIIENAKADEDIFLEPQCQSCCKE